jgi:hypothetical protein
VSSSLIKPHVHQHFTIMVLFGKIQQAKSNKQVSNSKQLDKVTYVAASAIDQPQGKWDQTY